MIHDRHEPVNWAAISMQEILERAIADEIEARDYYKRAAALAGSIHTQRVLQRLSEMEQGHADDLQKELDELLCQRDLEAGMAD